MMHKIVIKFRYRKKALECGVYVTIIVLIAESNNAQRSSFVLNWLYTR